MHRIRPTRRGFLLAAGVKIPAPYRVLAHSDGDFIFHAVSDALASSLGTNDIGHFFPPGKPETKAMNSAVILKHYLRALIGQGAQILSVSVVVAAQKPKLAAHCPRIRSALSEALAIPLHRVGLTMKTFEAVKPLASNCVACWATCLVEEGRPRMRRRQK
ncbi:MAG: 2-C-methyl-D-erythritol 2,4-cyclodiphosphate synthase [Elusimicrobia bacterium]|nr:2-C-methyl-D-erythritol 2,4-cyclodiphosphate synthase [Elusimicrobiota bacterium]